ncbi:MAG: hypothetical protein V1652_02870 [bacterium]
MESFLSPIGMAFIILGVLLLFCMFAFYRFLQYRVVIEPMIPRVIRINFTQKGTFKNIIKHLRTPFALEIALDQFGTEMIYYVIVPSKHIDEVRQSLPAPGEIVNDYEMYTSEGVHRVFTIVAKEELQSFSAMIDICENLDFSPVNEIGESAVVQWTVKRKENGKYAVTIRLLVSSSTDIQTEEIIRSIQCSFPQTYVLEEITEGDYLYEMTFRKFNEAYEILLDE